MRSFSMTCVIRLLEVERDERQALCTGKIEPRQHGIHARLERNLSVERFPSRGPNAVDLDLRSHPEHGRRALALLLSRDPDRLAAPPATFLGGGVAHREQRLEFRIVDRVADDAVVLWIQARDDGVVIRKGQRRKRGYHRLRRDAFAAECVERRDGIGVEIAASESVHRDEYHLWRGTGRRYTGRWLHRRGSACGNDDCQRG